MWYLIWIKEKVEGNYNFKDEENKKQLIFVTFRKASTCEVNFLLIFGTQVVIVIWLCKSSMLCPSCKYLKAGSK